MGRVKEPLSIRHLSNNLTWFSCYFSSWCASFQMRSRWKRARMGCGTTQTKPALLMSQPPKKQDLVEIPKHCLVCYPCHDDTLSSSSVNTMTFSLRGWCWESISSSTWEKLAPVWVLKWDLTQRPGIHSTQRNAAENEKGFWINHFKNKILGFLSI